MLRYLNVLAIGALVGSAVYAYSIKYETILYSEQIVKIQHQINAEQDKINMLRAEWSYLMRPERLQTLSDRHLDLQQLAHSQIILSANEMPDQPPKVDSIGRKLEALGLGDLGDMTAREEKKPVARASVRPAR
jgi:cell division protein FtsL